MGGAIYITLSNITFAENSSIQFINNTALQDGGAVYLSDHSNFKLTNNTKVNFSDNFANDDGEIIYVQIKESSIDLNISEIYFRNISYKKPVYINVPNSCNKSCLFQSVTKIQRISAHHLPLLQEHWYYMIQHNILMLPAQIVMCITSVM